MVRVEIEFNSTDEANQFIPFNWLGKEITTTPLAKDETLFDLKDKDFKRLLLASKSK